MRDQNDLVGRGMKRESNERVIFLEGIIMG